MSPVSLVNGGEGGGGGVTTRQCCGPDPGPFWPLDPGWVKSKDPDPGWTTRIMFPRAHKPFFWVKILKLFDADPGWKNSDPGWKKVESAINIPDPQHWNKDFDGGPRRATSALRCLCIKWKTVGGNGQVDLLAQHTQNRGGRGGGRACELRVEKEAGKSLSRNFSYRAVGPPPAYQGEGTQPPSLPLSLSQVV